MNTLSDSWLTFIITFSLGTDRLSRPRGGGGAGGRGGGGFLKNRVFENFTPPKKLSNKSFTPHCNDSCSGGHGWPGGWIVEKVLGTTLGYMRKSLALWIWTGKRNDQKLGKIQVRERTLDHLFNVLIITMFCYCWSLFFSRQKKVHKRSTQLGVWEQYRSIWCMDVDI